MQRPFDPADEAGRAAFPVSDRPASKRPDRASPFELPELPYGYADLEPIIDAETLKLHHNKHHRAYVDGLNEVLARHPRLRGSTLKSLLCDRAKVPEDIRTSVHDLGGGHYNHTLFWLSMTPKSGAVGGDLRRAVDEAFGSFDGFQSAFEAAGMRHFGSGWVYLVANSAHRFALEIVTLANSDTPLDARRIAILGCDLWEHAYYLKYRNRRADWLKAWWQVVDWEAAGTRLEHAKWSRG